MQIDLKKLISKVVDAFTQPSVVCVEFQQTITSKTTGSKTASATINVPDGYEIVPNCRPLSIFVSGAATVSVTDRGSVSMNGSTCSFAYYLNNPNNVTANMTINATILCRRVGGYCVAQLLQGFWPFSAREVA